MEPRTRERIQAGGVAATFLLVGLVICAESLQVPFGSLRMPGAGFFPLLLGITLSALAVILFATEWLGEERVSTRLRPDRPEVLKLMGALLLAVWLFDRAGFLFAMSVFMVVSTKVLGRGWVTAVATAVIGSVAAYWIFGRLLQISLPGGILGL